MHCAYRTLTSSLTVAIVCWLAAGSPTAFGAASAKSPSKAMEGYAEVAALQVVDCLLPGQVRRLGNRTYITPRRPIKTTAADCKVRGGEYTAYDRADYKSALEVWMPAAQAGDPEAQTNVGEIFEKGLGTEPNYQAAAHWYQQAADQGYTRAEFNLGTLYEQGLGVEHDKLKALNWYRKAWGIAEDDVMFASVAERQREDLRNSLESEVRQKAQQIDLLEKQLEELQRKLNVSAEHGADAQAQAQTLKTLIEQLQAQQTQSEERLADLVPATEPAPAGATSLTREPSPAEPVKRHVDAKERKYHDLSLGRYYALLIGNQHYKELENLQTPLSDVHRAEKILKEKYGFTVFSIDDGDNIEIMRAINDLYEVVGPQDNLLIFYAGHGNRLNTGGTEIGYWLPANAERPPRNTYWVANEFVTGHLSRIKAKRVLVVADSCYAGLLSREPSFLLFGDDGPSYDNMDFLRFKLDKRSRLLLSSGGDSPVLDQGADGHSVFAKAFLDELEKNNRLLPSPELYLHIRDEVKLAAEHMGFEETPEFKTIKAAGHEVGDFFFVPTDLR